MTDRGRFRRRCVECGYVTEGARAYICPECSVDLRDSFVAWARRRRGRALAYRLALAACAVCALFVVQLEMLPPILFRDVADLAFIGTAVIAPPFVFEFLRLLRTPERYGRLSRRKARRTRRVWAAFFVVWGGLPSLIVVVASIG